MALKKKKMYETQLEQCENNILRVNEQQMMLENQRTTVETVSALRDAAHASKYTMSEMKITDVDQVCVPYILCTGWAVSYSPTCDALHIKLHWMGAEQP